MSNDYRWWPWLIANWSRLALPCAVVTLATLPILFDADHRSVALASTLLPVYMIHQYEEHAHGRFVAFFNATVGNGHAVLTDQSAFWINVLGVWVLFLVALFLARFVAVGLLLVPVYLTLINGVIHILTSLRFKRYNPGLSTSVLLFLPWGIFLLIYTRGAIHSDPLYHLIGLLAAILVHAAIALYAIGTRAKLAAGAAD